MDTNTVRNILSDMLQSLWQSKSEDVIYYERQVKRILSYIEWLEKSAK